MGTAAANDQVVCILDLVRASIQYWHMLGGWAPAISEVLAGSLTPRGLSVGSNTLP